MGNKAPEQPKQLIPPTGDFLDKPVQFGPYYLLQQIGKGSFGVAYLAVLRRDITLPPGSDAPSCRDIYVFALTNEKRFYVVKRFRVDLEADEVAGLSPEQKEALVAEKKAMFESERRQAAWLRSQIPSHQNLVEYITEIEDAEQKTSALVFEYCNCGDIRRLISRCKDGSGKLTHLTLFEILHIGVQLARGLSVLAEHKIVHRDLALRNLFVHFDTKTGDLTFKIGDFGLCLDLGDVGTTSDSGKFGIHVAPEKAYNEKSDVYALGLVLYELLSLVDLSHDTLYAHNTTTLTAERKGIETELKSLHHADFAAVVSRMLASHPAKRVTAAEVHKILADMLKQTVTAKKQGQFDAVVFMSFVSHPFVFAADSKFRPWLSEVARASASQCVIAELNRKRARVFEEGEPTFLFTIKARDPLGQRRLSGGDEFVVTLKTGGGDARDRKVDAKDEKPTVVHNGDGSYDVHCLSNKNAHTAFVSVLLNGQHLPGSPFSMAFVKQLAPFIVKDSDDPRIAFGNDDCLYAAAGAKVACFGPDGAELRRWHCSRADGLAVGSDGLVFAPFSMMHCVYVFRSDGMIVRKWGNKGEGAGELSWPTSIAVDTKANETFVLDKYDRRIQVFACDGKFLRVCAEQSDSGFSDIALDSHQLYAINNHPLGIHVFNRDGKLIRSWNHESLHGPRTIAVSGTRVFVCDSGHVLVFDVNGILLFAVPSPGAAHVAVDPVRPNTIFVSGLPGAIFRFQCPDQ